MGTTSKYKKTEPIKEVLEEAIDNIEVKELTLIQKIKLWLLKIL